MAVGKQVSNDDIIIQDSSDLVSNMTNGIEESGVHSIFETLVANVFDTEKSPYGQNN